MFVYQLTLDTLELKEDKAIDYVPSLKLKGVYSSKLRPLYTAFLHSINVSGHQAETLFGANSIVKKGDKESGVCTE